MLGFPVRSCPFCFQAQICFLPQLIRTWLHSQKKFYLWHYTKMLIQFCYVESFPFLIFLQNGGDEACFLHVNVFCLSFPVCDFSFKEWFNMVSLPTQECHHRDLSSLGLVLKDHAPGDFLVCFGVLFWFFFSPREVHPSWSLFPCC